MPTPPKVLIIDDEPGIRRVVERSLSGPYQVLAAADGQLGLALALKEKPQLIILDLRLPDLDGLSVLARLKTNAETQGIPVVVASVLGETELLFEAKQSGAADQLIKPYTVEALRNTVRRNVRVEFSSPSRQAASGAKPRLSSRRVRPTILVIDDEEGIQRMIQRALEPDYSVILAGNGQEGLQWARACRPQLILLDIHLPELDGLSVLARLKAEARTAHIPVALISVQGASEALMEGQQAGAVDYLVKPFHPDALYRLVDRHVRVE